ncbi:ABC transporter substrate-binding protein [Galbitalea soli]|uniref:ABC transporter substrate-binding protein n=1 Tax=Galbitalea soli TaxID=1268042 RepID=A0A7C9TMN6_9MICO|nr:ABC transporter substrate-binding protein [Galbitalea soli]NEM89778.1 ABC transporter substrate-binding protein [Galbitalea soli]NYJ30481.1 polar amino acid transport system substrate-binding protein [Galbitalea soli]
MRIRHALPLIAVVTAIALTGCVNNTPAPAPTATVGASTKDATLASLLPASIKSAGVIQVGVDATYAPNEYKDPSGNAIGWDIDLFNAVAAKLGVKANYNIAGFDTIIPNITGGKYDAGVSSFTDTAEREKQVDFVNYYSAGILWASAAGKTVDPSNACGLKVAVESGTTEQQDEVPAKSAACVKAGKKPIQILKYDGQDLATNAVVLGQADAMSADSPITEYAIAKSGGKLQAAGTTTDVAPYGIAVAKGSTLGTAVQKALQALVDDGSYKAILTKWGVADGGLTTITINAAANG